MPATTQLGFRIPLDSDPAADGAKAVRELGQDVDDKIGVAAVGSVPITVTASSNGSAAVLFPSGRFTAPPVVVVSLGPAQSGKLIPRIAAPTKDGFTAFVFTGDGTSVTSTATVYWHAIQQ